jgi:hypothetical protein
VGFGRRALFHISSSLFRWMSCGEAVQAVEDSEQQAHLAQVIASFSSSGVGIAPSSNMQQAAQIGELRLFPTFPQASAVTAVYFSF